MIKFNRASYNWVQMIKEALSREYACRTSEAVYNRAMATCAWRNTTSMCTDVPVGLFNTFLVLFDLFLYVVPVNNF